MTEGSHGRSTVGFLHTLKTRYLGFTGWAEYWSAVLDGDLADGVGQLRAAGFCPIGSTGERIAGSVRGDLHGRYRVDAMSEDLMRKFEAG